MKGHTFALEAQGSGPQPWFAALDWLILNPKPPSSEMVTDSHALNDCVAVAKGGTHCVVN